MSPLSHSVLLYNPLTKRCFTPSFFSQAKASFPFFPFSKPTVFTSFLLPPLLDLRSIFVHFSVSCNMERGGGAIGGGRVCISRKWKTSLLAVKLSGKRDRRQWCCSRRNNHHHRESEGWTGWSITHSFLPTSLILPHKMHHFIHIFFCRKCNSLQSCS